MVGGEKEGSKSDRPELRAGAGRRKGIMEGKGSMEEWEEGKRRKEGSGKKEGNLEFGERAGIRGIAIRGV